MKIAWTERARLELIDLFFFLEENFGKPTAIKAKNRIKADVLLLKKQPYLGKLEPLLVHRMVSYRSLVSGYNKIIYYIEDDTVYICALLNCRQNPDNLGKEVL